MPDHKKTLTVEELINKARSDPKSLTVSEYEKAKRLIRDAERRASKLDDGKLTKVERQRNTMARRERELREAARNIGTIPAVADPDRRESCKRSLQLFIETYGGPLSPFSDDHIRVIHRIELAIFEGGRFVEAVYRGFGKSTLSNFAGPWAILYGHKRFIELVRANGELAKDSIDAIKSLLISEPLASDFPEVCFPLQRLEGINQRAHAQIYSDPKTEKTVSTALQWSGNTVVLPWTSGAPSGDGWQDNLAAGSVIFCAGITSSSLRGPNHTRPDGETIRPDFAIIDDPQDAESAASLMQVRKRLNLIQKDIIKSAGHQSSMSVVMPCTVIERGDMIDQLLDASRFPAWQGERIKLVKQWATHHDEMWMDAYAAMRNTYDPEDPEDFKRARAKANDYYRDNRDKMDEGCVVSWAHCYDPDLEQSAIQHAYNALIDDGPEVFASEFQNEPLAPPEEEGQLTLDVIYQRITDGIQRGEVPEGASRLTGFIDVQHSCLVWMVCAWLPGFTGAIIDYGVYPEQGRVAFSMKDIRIKLSDRHTGAGQEAQWHAGLEALTESLMTRTYADNNGVASPISRLLIDANEGSAMITVFNFARTSKYNSVVMPSRGKAVGAAGIPFSDYRRKPGDIVGPNDWRIPSPRGQAGRQARCIFWDVNSWKSQARQRLMTMPGDPGAIQIFRKEKNGNDATQQQLAEHMVSEYSIRTSGRGRSVDEWSRRPNAENHLWDCFVGCCVAASEQNIALGQMEPTGRRSKRKMTRHEKLAMIGRPIG